MSQQPTLFRCSTPQDSSLRVWILLCTISLHEWCVAVTSFIPHTSAIAGHGILSDVVSDGPLRVQHGWPGPRRGASLRTAWLRLVSLRASEPPSLHELRVKAVGSGAESADDGTVDAHRQRVPALPGIARKWRSHCLLSADRLRNEWTRFAQAARRRRRAKRRGQHLQRGAVSQCEAGHVTSTREITRVRGSSVETADRPI